MADAESILWCWNAYIYAGFFYCWELILGSTLPYIGMFGVWWVVDNCYFVAHYHISHPMAAFTLHFPDFQVSEVTVLATAKVWGTSKALCSIFPQPTLQNSLWWTWPVVSLSRVLVVTCSESFGSQFCCRSPYSL